MELAIDLLHIGLIRPSHCHTSAPQSESHCANMHRIVTPDFRSVINRTAPTSEPSQSGSSSYVVHARPVEIVVDLVLSCGILELENNSSNRPTRSCYLVVSPKAEDEEAEK